MSRVNGSDYINLKVIGEDGSEIHFNVKPSTRLGKVKNSYAKRLKVAVTSLRFVYNSCAIERDDVRVSELELKNDDIINVSNVEQKDS